MNAYMERLMGCPDVETEWDGCAVCGRPARERHHIVPRSQGGTDGPTVRLCGWGNTGGCHGDAHAHKLHFRFADGRWQYLLTDEPTKYEKALEFGGWKDV